MTLEQFIALMPNISSDLVAVELFRRDGVFDYLNEFYDILHTTGYPYINNDIYLKSRNAVITA